MQYSRILFAIFPSLALAEHIPNPLLATLQAQQAAQRNSRTTHHDSVVRNYRGAQLATTPPGVPVFVRERRNGCLFYRVCYWRDNQE